MFLYVALGALLMILTFSASDFKERLPLYLANINIARMQRGDRPITNEKRFSIILLVLCCLVYVFAWPLVLAYAIVKTIIE